MTLFKWLKKKGFFVDVKNEKEMEARPKVTGEKHSPAEVGQRKEGGRTFLLFGKKWKIWGLVAVAGLALSGCANVSTTKFTYTSPEGGSVSVEMPKEMTASNLQVVIDAKGGSATVSADSISTSPVAGMQIEAIRQTQVLQEMKGIVKEGLSGAAEGAAKGILPIAP